LNAPSLPFFALSIKTESISFELLLMYIFPTPYDKENS